MELKKREKAAGLVQEGSARILVHRQQPCVPGPWPCRRVGTGTSFCHRGQLARADSDFSTAKQQRTCTQGLQALRLSLLHAAREGCNAVCGRKGSALPAGLWGLRAVNVSPAACLGTAESAAGTPASQGPELFNAHRLSLPLAQTTREPWLPHYQE